jgi:hypothetical protein
VCQISGHKFCISYENKVKSMIEKKNGVKMNTEDSDVILQVVNECTNSVVSHFELNSFKKKSEQQVQLKKKFSKRWHPALICWCLFMESKSVKA